mmetsp:Transcript_9269/g.25008  ORF Transcript_9269/g.25008 Transcript_9269/m.25008 type:complete len:96 (+) Transcript_9269:847-1134(+)
MQSSALSPLPHPQQHVPCVPQLQQHPHVMHLHSQPLQRRIPRHLLARLLLHARLQLCHNLQQLQLHQLLRRIRRTLRIMQQQTAPAVERSAPHLQ